jgi:hypothetical protein
MNYTYSDFEQKFKKINSNSRETIEKFIQLRANENYLDGNYHYSLNYLNNQLTDNHKHFYSLFEFNNDTIFAGVTKVRMGPGQYNRLIEIPISESGNHDNELSFMELLFNSNYIDQAFISKHNLKYLDKTKYFSNGVADYNFYINIVKDLQLKHVNKSRLELVTENKEFYFRETLLSDKEKLFEVFNNWAMSHSEDLHSLTLFKNYFYNFNTLVTYKQLLQYTLTYNNIPIAIVAFIPTLQGYCYQPIQFAYRRDIFLGNDVLYKVLSQIAGILQYLFCKKLYELGFKYISLAGTGGNSKGLLKNKETLADCIEYYRILKGNK